MAALAGLNVIALAEDWDGGVWAGTREGQVWRLRRGEWMAQTNYSQSHAITAIWQDSDGTMWIGTEGNGLYRCRDGSRAHFEKGGGLLSDWIRTLHLDAQGTLWIGTVGGGLSRWRDEHLTTFTTREGLPDNTISQILEDDAGRLWLGSNRGIACVSKAELEELAAGKVAVVYPQVYGRAEGMPSEECTGGYFPAGLKTKSGWLCFSTLKGIVVVNPRSQRPEAPVPAVVLEETLVDGVAADTLSSAPSPTRPTTATSTNEKKEVAANANWTRTNPKVSLVAPSAIARRPGPRWPACSSCAQGRPGQTPPGVSLHRDEPQRAGKGALSLSARTAGYRLGGGRGKAHGFLQLRAARRIPVSRHRLQ